MKVLIKIILLLTVTLTLSWNGQKALIKNTKQKKERPLCILEKSKDYTLSLNSLHEYEKDKYKEMPFIDEVYLNNGDFFLQYETTFSINDGFEPLNRLKPGYEVIESETSHFIPANDGSYEIKTLLMYHIEYQDGKEIFQQHRPFVWVNEGSSRTTAKAAKVLEYYFRQKRKKRK